MKIQIVAALVAVAFQLSAEEEYISPVTGKPVPADGKFTVEQIKARDARVMQKTGDHLLTVMPCQTHCQRVQYHWKTVQVCGTLMRVNSDAQGILNADALCRSLAGRVGQRSVGRHYAQHLKDVVIRLPVVVKVVHCAVAHNHIGAEQALVKHNHCLAIACIIAPRKTEGLVTLLVYLGQRILLSHTGRTLDARVVSISLRLDRRLLGDGVKRAHISPSVIVNAHDALRAIVSVISHFIIMCVPT